MTRSSSDTAAPRPAAWRQGGGPVSPSPLTVDLALVVASFLLEVVGIVGRAVNESGEFSLAMLGDVPAGTYMLLGLSSVALLWRRRHPIFVLVATLAASVVWDVIDLPDGPSLAILVSLYGVGRYVTERRITALALGMAMVVVAVDDVLIEDEEPSVVALSLGLVILAWYLGRRVESRRAYLELLEERAYFLERERNSEARRAVAEERTRIARELHDVVAHRVSLITVQAGAAQAVAASDPDRAMQAMEAVESEGREALGELREILGVLRADADEQDLAPRHGLAEIGDLGSETERAGVDVSIVDHGAPSDLPVQVDLAAYRIVQEALTNVVKHGGPSASAVVRLAEEDGHLVISVADDGSGVSTLPGSGHGLAGMRERVALLGGTLEAGPRLEGGFGVLARLPLDRSRT